MEGDEEGNQADDVEKNVKRKNEEAQRKREKKTASVQLLLWFARANSLRCKLINCRAQKPTNGYKLVKTIHETQ